MSLGRRRLLVVGGGAVCAHVIGCGGSEPTVLSNQIPAGNKAAVALDTLTPVGGAAVAIGRDSGGIYAISLVCTHQSCNIAQSGGSVGFNLIHCGCHGSEFDGQGNVTHGPATQPLPHLAVTADMAGALTIHGDMPVSAMTRLPV
jgi:cytochrome b6-f complex iron-sulfur subunit